MYGMSKSGKKKAVLENILSVINKLKEYKVSEIITICDANIRAFLINRFQQYILSDEDKAYCYAVNPRAVD